MYIIENGKAYLIDGEVGYLVNFGIDGKMVIDKENTIEINGKVKYTYNEVYKKLNIAFRIEEAKKQQTLNESISEKVKELKEQIDILTKENDELKKQIKSFNNTNKDKEEESTSKEKKK